MKEGNVKASSKKDDTEILKTSSRADLNTIFEIFIFCPKIQLWFPEKIGVDNFDFTRIIVKKILCWKTRENVGHLHFLAVDHCDFPRKNSIVLFVNLQVGTPIHMVGWIIAF